MGQSGDCSDSGTPRQSPGPLPAAQGMIISSVKCLQSGLGGGLNKQFLWPSYPILAYLSQAANLSSPATEWGRHANAIL